MFSNSWKCSQPGQNTTQYANRFLPWNFRKCCFGIVSCPLSMRDDFAFNCFLIWSVSHFVTANFGEMVLGFVRRTSRMALSALRRFYFHNARLICTSTANGRPHCTYKDVTWYVHGRRIVRHGRHITYTYFSFVRAHCTDTLYVHVHRIAPTHCTYTYTTSMIVRTHVRTRTFTLYVWWSPTSVCVAFYVHGRHCDKNITFFAYSTRQGKINFGKTNAL
jgi:hypothetical protein